ncbi:MAG: hypothetical protein AB7G11_10745 [Phycisphaerales bacterium]
MFARNRAIVCAAGCLLAVSAAEASIINASRVEHFAQGTQSNGAPVVAERSDPAQALGAPQNADYVNFVSIGFGGTLVLGFDQAFMEYVQIVETTYNNPALHPEACEVFVGVGPSWDTAQYYSLGIRQNTEDDVLMPLGPANIQSGTTFYNFLMIQDRCNPDLLPQDADGYDVDGVITVGAPVPAPAGAVVGLIGSLAASARRRRR